MTGAPAPQPGQRGSGARPHPELPEGTDMIPQIKHIVVLMMENHSYDNHLGMLSRTGADGFTLGSDGKPMETNPYPDGRIQHAFRMPTTCQLSGQPSQTWQNLLAHVHRFAARVVPAAAREVPGPSRADR